MPDLSDGRMTGRTVYADVFDVTDRARLDDGRFLTEALQLACLRGNATVLQAHAHRFEPQGVTAFCLLAESHAAVHTYPEEAAYMLDVFTCGDRADPRLIAESVVDVLGGTARYRQVERGGCAQQVSAA